MSKGCILRNPRDPENLFWQSKAKCRRCGELCEPDSVILTKGKKGDPLRLFSFKCLCGHKWSQAVVLSGSNSEEPEQPQQPQDRYAEYSGDLPKPEEPTPDLNSIEDEPEVVRD